MLLLEDGVILADVCHQKEEYDAKYVGHKVEFLQLIPHDYLCHYNFITRLISMVIFIVVACVLSHFSDIKVIDHGQQVSTKIHHPEHYLSYLPIVPSF